MRGVDRIISLLSYLTATLVIPATAFRHLRSTSWLLSSLYQYAVATGGIGELIRRNRRKDFGGGFNRPRTPISYDLYSASVLSHLCANVPRPSTRIDTSNGQRYFFLFSSTSISGLNLRIFLRYTDSYTYTIFFVLRDVTVS